MTYKKNKFKKIIFFFFLSFYLLLLLARTKTQPASDLIPKKTIQIHQRHQRTRLLLTQPGITGPTLPTYKILICLDHTQFPLPMRRHINALPSRNRCLYPLPHPETCWTKLCNPTIPVNLTHKPHSMATSGWNGLRALH